MISVRVKNYAIGLAIFLLGSVTSIGALAVYALMTTAEENCSENDWDDVRPKFRSFLQVKSGSDKEELQRYAAATAHYATIKCADSVRVGGQITKSQHVFLNVS